jgi:hypothetical protein
LLPRPVANREWILDRRCRFRGLIKTNGPVTAGAVRRLSLST